jgi:hypothetical protein
MSPEATGSAAWTVCTACIPSCRKATSESIAAADRSTGEHIGSDGSFGAYARVVLPLVTARPNARLTTWHGISLKWRRAIALIAVAESATVFTWRPRWAGTTCRSDLLCDHFLGHTHNLGEPLVNVSVGDAEVGGDELCTGELLLILLAAA